MIEPDLIDHGLRAFAAAVAPHLDGWSVEPDERLGHLVHLVKGQDRLTLLGSFASVAGRAVVTVCEPDTDHRGRLSRRSRPEITVSMLRDPRAVARDIERRLVPDALAFLVECRAEIAELDAADAARRDAVGRLLEEVPDARVRHFDGSSEIRFDRPVPGLVKLGGAAQLLGIELKYVPVDTARRLLAALVPHGTIPVTEAPATGDHNEGSSPLVWVVLDGPPGPVPGRFVELEDAEGRSVAVAHWVERPDRLWSLGPLAAAPRGHPDASAAQPRFLPGGETTDRKGGDAVPVNDTEQGPGWSPEYEPWRHAGWYVTNVRYPGGAVGCVSRNYPDRRWRIVCSDLDVSFATRDAAARAERLLTLHLAEAAPADEVLDRLAGILDGTEWSPDTLDTIAAVLRSAGRTVGDRRPADELRNGEP